MACYALRILFIWQVVQGSLNRKLRVHFRCLGRFSGDFGSKIHPFRPRYAYICHLLFGSWPTVTRYMKNRSKHCSLTTVIYHPCLLIQSTSSWSGVMEYRVAAPPPIYGLTVCAALMSSTAQILKQPLFEWGQVMPFIRTFRSNSKN